jgi:hypothetical protein
MGLLAKIKPRTTVFIIAFLGTQIVSGSSAQFFLLRSCPAKVSSGGKTHDTFIHIKLMILNYFNIF